MSPVTAGRRAAHRPTRPDHHPGSRNGWAGRRGQPLSVRELEVIAALAAGDTVAAIARRRFRSLGTIKGHIALAKEKLGARTAAHAVALAYQCGALTVGTQAEQVDGD